MAEELAKKQAEADKDAHEHWKVEDGVLVYSGKGKMSLCTGKDYGNFELYCDWKSRRTATAAFISAERRKADLGPLQRAEHKKRRGEGFRKFVEQQKESQVPQRAGRQPDRRVEHVPHQDGGREGDDYLNGKLIVDNVTLENYWEPEKPIYPKGQIELQDHGNTLYFRNIYIKELL